MSVRVECLQLVRQNPGLQCRGWGSEGRMARTEEKASFTCSSVLTVCLLWAGHVPGA